MNERILQVIIPTLTPPQLESLVCFAHAMSTNSVAEIETQLGPEYWTPKDHFNFSAKINYRLTGPVEPPYGA